MFSSESTDYDSKLISPTESGRFSKLAKVLPDSILDPQLQPDPAAIEENCLTFTKGSLTATVFTQISLILGVGVLGLPHTFVAAGFVSGIIFVIFGGFAGIWSLQNLIRCSHQTKKTNYSEIVAFTLGKRAAKVFDWLYIIYILGVMTNLQITSSTFVEALAPVFGFKINRKYEIIVAAVIMYPLACAKSLAHLRHLSLAILAIVLYVVILVIMQFYPYMKHAQSDPTAHFTLYNMDFSALSAFAVAILAFNGAPYVLNVQAELKNSTVRRMTKVCRISIAVVMVLYLSIAVFGYLTAFDATPGLITERLPLPGSNDYPMIAAKILFAVLITFAVALRANPIRKQIYLAFDWKNQDDTFKRCAITFLLLAITAGLAIALPDIYSAFSILGGTIGTVLLITFPGIIYYMTFPEETDLQKFKTIAITGVCTVLGLTGAITTLINVISNKKT